MKKSLSHTGAFLAVAAIGVVALVLLTSCGAVTAIPSAPEPTPTPEVFIPLDKAIPDQGITLEGVHLEIVNATLDTSFPAGCAGEAPACTQAQNGYGLFSVTFQPRDLPEGQMLAYKNLPTVSIIVEGDMAIPHSLYKYDNATQTLALGFEVPEGATTLKLKWADLAEIPLNVTP